MFGFCRSPRILHRVLHSIALLSLSRFILMFSFTGEIFAVFGTRFLGIHCTACVISRLSNSLFQDCFQFALSGEFCACRRVLGPVAIAAAIVCVGSSLGSWGLKSVDLQIWTLLVIRLRTLQWVLLFRCRNRQGHARGRNFSFLSLRGCMPVLTEWLEGCKVYWGPGPVVGWY